MIDGLSKRRIVWSYGGGKQSAAIAALIIQSKLPKPDLIVMADTERERSSTWRYLRSVIRPALREIGLDIWIVPKSQYATVDLFSKSGDVLIPAFTTQSGKVGMLNTYCSNEWKRRVIMRWLADYKFKPVEVWMGISTDEAHRMKTSDVQWLSHVYPLCDLGVSRNECIRVVQDMGWPPAPKSTCFMCPHLSDATWREMRQDDPEDFQKAIEIEAMIHLRDPEVYLHRSGVPLNQIRFNDGTFESFDGCDSGYCWV